MSLDGFEKYLLSEKWLEAIKDFDCCSSKCNNFEKLNKFLKESGLKYNQGNLSRTNIYVNNGMCIAYYSLAMNAIKDPRINVEEEYRVLTSYPALFLTRLAVDKRYQHKRLGKMILNSIIKHAYENKETAARFLFLDAYPESISWYLSNPLFQILYTTLSERIEERCERIIIERLNRHLMQGHTISCKLNGNTDVESAKDNCEKILTAHVRAIFEEFITEVPLLKICNSKINLIFENNKPKIKLENFNIKKNTLLIRDWLKNKNNTLSLDTTIPLYVDINKYYQAIYG